MKKITASLLLLVLISALFTGSIMGQTKYVVKFATLAPEGSTWMNILNDLNEEIKLRTNNQLRFNFYPGGIMGADLDVVRKMRYGQIHCAGLTGKGMGHILGDTRILEIPFLFNNEDEVDYVYQKLFSDFNNMFIKKGFVLLGWAEIGFLHMFSNKPITSLEDLKRVKMWMWEGDRLAEELFTVFGITPNALSPPVVLDALQMNKIDAFYNSPLGAIAYQWFSKVRYMTEIPLANGAGVVLISKKLFDKLPPELQNILRDSCAKYLRKLVLESRKDNKSSIETLRKQGISIVPVNDEAQIENFKALSQKVQTNLVDVLYSQKTLDLVLTTLSNFRNTEK